MREMTAGMTRVWARSVSEVKGQSSGGCTLSKDKEEPILWESSSSFPGAFGAGCGI